MPRSESVKGCECRYHRSSGAEDFVEEDRTADIAGVGEQGREFYLRTALEKTLLPDDTVVWPVVPVAGHRGLPGCVGLKSNDASAVCLERAWVGEAGAGF